MIVKLKILIFNSINYPCFSKQGFFLFGRALVWVIARNEAIFSKLGRAVRYNPRDCHVVPPRNDVGFPLPSLTRKRRLRLLDFRLLRFSRSAKSPDFEVKKQERVTMKINETKPFFSRTTAQNTTTEE